MNLSADAVRRLEEKTRHTFRDLGRLERALTHASARPSAGSDYERLEFLGDRVLGLVIAELLFRAYPTASEGELSLRLNSLVNADTCAAVADEIGLHEFIRTGSDVKGLADKRLKSLRADVVESLIATIYLDGGLEAAQPFIERYWNARSREINSAQRDPKTELQEWAHQQDGAQPIYSVVDRTGPDHDPLFTVKVDVKGFASATGTGRSKRIAEQNAAVELLYREGVRQKTQEEEEK
ncbi:RNAse III [Phyllobacterium sp. YR620]|uniref:Ribonuclease 3 n=1 Tax=Phyllobacterium pellucidum TaxID=2740464 RepID=A0A849VIR0_9HYPH|nr:MULTISPECIES: ribonuclease III [Phyllobacterium]MRG55875.1 ribonuclease III [Phyllobacterium sp. SYP-B3895]NTS30085.1 ribonuclease III [Phyllobacterium pellucidum]UGY08113.1 ribonuclease III [Phyllobacterium sp. T1018]SDP55954.1 RNAse III [Phyllobacterium sp. YR620]SFI50496.1 RNAse III [Phyllobacterium sp. CL33Tsu]